MVHISTRTWGMIITMTPPVGKTDLARFFDELRMSHLQESKGFFGVLFDMSTLGPLHPDLRDHMVSALRLLLQRGMIRSAICVNNALLVSQLKRLHAITETSPGTRFLDASMTGCRSEAEQWASNGLEPANQFEAPSSSAPT